MSYRLTWLHNAPSPNQMEFFQAIASRPGVRLRVLHCARRFSTRPFSLGDPWLQGPLLFEHKVLRGWDLRLGRNREFHVNPEILRAVSQNPSDEIWLVGGHTIPTVQMAMWALTLRRLRWILVTEPPKERSAWRNLVRDTLLVPARLGARGIIVYGSRQKAEYFAQRFPPGRIFITPQYQNLAPLRAIPRQSNGNRALCFFYAGRIEPYSGVQVVVKAFHRVAARYPDVRLEILGDGSLRAALQNEILEPLRSRVLFHGAVARDQVPDMFARGDVFLHANRGQGWGMVVNEALAAGMPVIASRKVGSAEALIADGVNGFLLELPDDEDGFAERMEFFARSREKLSEFSRNARRTADSITLETGVNEFFSILDKLAR